MRWSGPALETTSKRTSPGGRMVRSRRRPSGNRRSGTLLRGIRSPFVADPNAFLSNGLQMTPRPGCAWRGRPSSPFGLRRTGRRSRVDTSATPHYKPPARWPFSGLPRHAQVAQLVEHATENRSVGGSIPPLGTIRSSTDFRIPPLTCFKRLKWMYFHPYLSAAIRGQPRKVLVALLVLMRCAVCRTSKPRESPTNLAMAEAYSF
jgi:hypothetical protein